jgi:hypothetical protein
MSEINFTVSGKITYDGTKGITRNITSISIDGSPMDLTAAKIVILNKIAELKQNVVGQKGGDHGFAKNSTEYKKQKEKLKSNTLRFKKNPHTKTYKK